MTMSKSKSVFLVEVDDVDAGLIVRVSDGFRFHAAERLFQPLEGRAFASLAQAERAARGLIAFEAVRAKAAVQARLAAPGDRANPGFGQ